MKSLRLDGIDYPIKHYPTTCDRHAVVMQDPTTGDVIASLAWHEWTGEIRQVRVECPGHDVWEESGGPHYCLRRRGIATALLGIARSVALVKIYHSPTRSHAGEAWAYAVAGPGETIMPREAIK
jgi:hypothetical protein